MAQYAIEDTTMTALADAIRGITGETRRVIVGTTYLGDCKVSKTDNALSFTEYDGGYNNNSDRYDIIKIPGAVKIVVDMAYQNEGGSYDYLQVASGELTSMSSSATKYASKTLTRKELTFTNTEAITFYFHSDSSQNDYLGYYAECRGYDVNDNLIEFYDIEYEEVPNTMTVAEMINMLEPGQLMFNIDHSLFYDSTTSSTSYRATIQVGEIMPNASKTPFLLWLSGCFSSTAYSPVCVFYDGAGNFTQIATNVMKPSGGTIIDLDVKDDIITVRFKGQLSNSYISSTYKDCVFVWVGPKKGA